jgi:hypothetical protein
VGKIKSFHLVNRYIFSFIIKLVGFGNGNTLLVGAYLQSVFRLPVAIHHLVVIREYLVFFTDKMPFSETVFCHAQKLLIILVFSIDNKKNCQLVLGTGSFFNNIKQ